MHIKKSFKKRQTDLFGLPHLQDGHASYYRVGILLCCGIHCVVGSNDQRQVRFCGPETHRHIRKTDERENRLPNVLQLSSLMLLGSLAPHLSPFVINRTICPRQHAWLLRKQDCCPDNMACPNTKTQHKAVTTVDERGGFIRYNWSSNIIQCLSAKMTTL